MEAIRTPKILHMHIASIAKLPISANGTPLQIRCKNFLCVTFLIPKERDCHDIFISLQQLSQPLHINDLYCFHYTASNEDLTKSMGWNKFDFQAEYVRMGVPNTYWSATNINQDYEICDTYPRHLYVPSVASTAILVGSSQFRSKGRLPVLSYLNKNMAAICRCSQPLSGFSARCVEDEQLLNCILKSNPTSKFMYVVDTRPRINAMANKAAGKGYENENFYENIKFQFFGIENIHVMRNSLQKLIDTCEASEPSMGAFLGGLEASGWLRHVRAILETAHFVARAVEDGVSVLVHCSDGWDRTAQTCSLASLLLDPYYRTIMGFQALIEKDWLAFGHKFMDRCGLVQGDQREVAPVFTQFVDAVWQLMHQFPSSFQFNERFLLTIHDHVYSCQFGTFVGNCEKDRLDLRLSSRTYSLWAYLGNHISEYINPLYRTDRRGADTLHPSLAPQAIKSVTSVFSLFLVFLSISNNTPNKQATLRYSRLLCGDLCAHVQRIAQLRELLHHADTPSKDLDSVLGESLTGDELDSQPASSEGAVSVRDSGFGDADYNECKELQQKLHQHKLGDSFGSTVLQKLMEEFDSVAVDWKSFRNIKECPCSTPFDHFRRKVMYCL
ncbi:hypothetical protein HPB50_016456 [Hyalomma asiaticum]|uniref:Uncharacterized protein n=1 Tax=Hyalomma asiaticum TaxID=266040 RepID=A0ACB7SR42_HYAAI|nr:hypothetical protein HPB50_016456 [Hyalomma asiaticum]